METIVWPVYINSNHSRKEGRRLSLEESVDEPKIREISQALRRLKLQYTVEHDKSFPGSWWEKSGRVVVTHEYETKLELLRKISNTIKINRVSN
ncbi:signal recognition particle subunit SRP19/SEC65 family protein [Methanosphaera sp.]|uniref:signal recognition particle subunit SRP19/SEC65 family protein n=1 Tax=Methanosphaera sp. TaxID=2666342 RepID=UPI0025DF79DF|nr:signal recognition particle subunit SRP19/SEC65 family protein [Methanosphaera sp.]MEE1117587.1 signal recognition particle subunit SRP19/SEC65 family protein [Methanosphaera sp.]MEE3325216.1 signal recognition particle subunit SRP19/SEC65 family protein [Methanosphaera sp.]MEE3418777.1 signal recognition particle subunit SRP19/SEC65 family protein [Methanosphaera sp.]